MKRKSTKHILFNRYTMQTLCILRLSYKMDSSWLLHSPKLHHTMPHLPQDPCLVRRINHQALRSASCQTCSLIEQFKILTLVFSHIFPSSHIHIETIIFLFYIPSLILKTYTYLSFAQLHIYNHNTLPSSFFLYNY
jgi:hypothetical protein